MTKTITESVGGSVEVKQSCCGMCPLNALCNQAQPHALTIH